MSQTLFQAIISRMQQKAKQSQELVYDAERHGMSFISPLHQVFCFKMSKGCKN